MATASAPSIPGSARCNCGSQNCGSDRHRLVWEDLAPFAKGLVGGDQQRAAFVPGADKLKKDAGFSLVFGDVSEVIEDQEVEFVELGDGGFESELATGICSRRTRSVVRVNSTRQPPRWRGPSTAQQPKVR